MPNAHIRHSRYITLAGCKGTLTQQYIHRAEGGRHMPASRHRWEDRFSASLAGRAAVKDRLLYNEGPIPLAPGID